MITKEILREKAIRLLDYRCKIRWSVGYYSSKDNAVAGVLSGVIGDFLLVSTADEMVRVPVARVVSFEVLGPDWRWHHDLVLDGGSFHESREERDEPGETH